VQKRTRRLIQRASGVGKAPVPRDLCGKLPKIFFHDEKSISPTLITAANSLFCGGDTLWQNMCAEWAPSLDKESVGSIVRPIEEALAG
jgi:hypothetical protein